MLSIPPDSDHLERLLKSRFGEESFQREDRSPNRLQIRCDAARFPEIAAFIHGRESLESQYLTLVAAEEDNGFSLHLVLLLKPYRILLTIACDIDKDAPRYPALTPHIPAADWHEREIHDLFGIIPEGGNLQPLVLHRDWPRGEHFPMRRHFSESVPVREVPHQFGMPEGAGRHQVAVGPIHAGIIEPGHLRFSVTGEHIHRFDAQLFYTHKGLEKMAEGKPIADVLTLAEHVCGLCAFSHSLAFCQALEDLGGLETPSRAVSIRAILLEMERLASHMADLSAISSAGGFGFASARAAYFREQLLQLNHMLVGHRFLRGVNQPGGLKKNVSDEDFRKASETLRELQAQFVSWRELVLSTDSFLDRVEGTGFISSQTARTLGLVGPAARGSGIDVDMRRDFPYGAHACLSVEAPCYEDGDAHARMSVRMAEVSASLGQVQRLISGLPSGPVSITADTLHLPPRRSAIGLVESPKGSLLHWIVPGSDNRIERWHVRSASYMNWRGVVQATMGNNIVPDGPLVNKSFNLCYACVDR